MRARAHARERKVSQTDATSCRGESSLFVVAEQVFSKIWENLFPTTETRGTKEERRGVRVLRQWCRHRRQGPVHKEGSLSLSPPALPSSHLLASSLSLSLSFSLARSHGHSFLSSGKPEATGSYAPSSWLAFTASGFLLPLPVYRGTARCTLGARFPLLEKFRGFCRREHARVFLPRGEADPRKDVERVETNELHCENRFPYAGARARIQRGNIKYRNRSGFNNLKAVLVFIHAGPAGRATIIAQGESASIKNEIARAAVRSCRA